MGASGLKVRIMHVLYCVYLTSDIDNNTQIAHSSQRLVVSFYPRS